MRQIIDAIGLAVLVGGLAVALGGCGGTPAQQHRDLNRLTDVGDPTYAMALEACDGLRNHIVDRLDTTWEEDSRAMREVDAACDVVVDGMETLRGTQLTARAAIDSGVGGAATTAIAQALAMWPRVQALITNIEELGRESE